MYIETVPNRNSPPAVLLCEGWREGNKTRKRTLANLSHSPQPKIDTFRRLLQDEPLVSPQSLLATQRTLPHGHVEAILTAIRKLGLAVPQDISVMGFDDIAGSSFHSPSITTVRQPLTRMGQAAVILVPEKSEWHQWPKCRYRQTAPQVASCAPATA